MYVQPAITGQSKVCMAISLYAKKLFAKFSAFL